MDAYGNRRYVIQHGRLNITKHQSVLSALEKRALRFRSRKGFQTNATTSGDLLDETGTVSTEGMTDAEGDTLSEIDFNQREMEEIVGVSDELLNVHGSASKTKADGVTRFLYENANGFNSRIGGNEKLEKAKEVIDDLEADIIAFNEHRLNLQHKDNQNGFSQMFKGGEAEIRTITAHNSHEGKEVGRVQEGGTGLLLYGPLIEQYDFEESGKDGTGLGRWVVMVFRGQGNITTRVVCGYNPCYNKKDHSKTSYQQHRCYYVKKEKDTTCPRTRFRRNLIDQLTEWRANGDRLIVCLDANEHIYRKSIGKTLTDAAGLDMSEVVGDFTGRPLGATFFRGSKPIDGVWASKDVRVEGACVMPCGFGVGNHRMFVIDFATKSLIGAQPPRVIGQERAA